MTESRLARVDALDLLRTAARELLPVVVDMGPNQARFSSFVGSVSGEGVGRVDICKGIQALLSDDAEVEGTSFVHDETEQN